MNRKMKQAPINDIKCSIIIPIYKVEKYLRQCIDSVVNQTYKNIEVILVDDGSPDNCPKICDEYAEKDNRVKVIHKENGGLSSARNTGVENVSGQYTMFVDSDDWIDLDTIENCVNELVRAPEIDCILYSYIREYPQKSMEIHLFNGNQKAEGEYAKNLVYRRLFGPLNKELNKPEQVDSLGSCCMKFYRTELVRKGKYYETQEVGSSEDTLFNMYALADCQSYIYLDRCFYHYRKTKGTLTSTYRPKLVTQWGKLFDIIEKIILEKGLGEDYCNAFQNRIALSSIGIGMNIMGNQQESFLKRKSMVKAYLKTTKYQQAIKQMDFSKLPIKWKIFMLACKWKWAFMVSIMLCIMKKIKSKR